MNAGTIRCTELVTAEELIFGRAADPNHEVYPAGTPVMVCAMPIDKGLHPDVEGMVAEARRRNAGLPKPEWVVMMVGGRPRYLRHHQVKPIVSVSRSAAPTLTPVAPKPAASLFG